MCASACLRGKKGACSRRREHNNTRNQPMDPQRPNQPISLLSPPPPKANSSSSIGHTLLPSRSRCVVCATHAGCCGVTLRPLSLSLSPERERSAALTTTTENGTATTASDGPQTNQTFPPLPPPLLAAVCVCVSRPPCPCTLSSSSSSVCSSTAVRGFLHGVLLPQKKIQNDASGPRTRGWVHSRYMFAQTVCYLETPTTDCKGSGWDSSGKMLLVVRKF